MHLEKLTLVQQSATKEVQVLLVFDEIIMNLSNQYQNKIKKNLEIC